jgi:hypothetical protein
MHARQVLYHLQHKVRTNHGIIQCRSLKSRHSREKTQLPGGREREDWEEGPTTGHLMGEQQVEGQTVPP